MILLFLFVIGLVFGSFLAAFTWRTENDLSIAKGRSFCPKCKYTIAWYDNVPLLSYLLLHGKCRNCKKHISYRYPLIELSVGLSFVFVYFAYWSILNQFQWLGSFDIWGMIFILFLAVTSIGIVVTDIEEMIIPDELVHLLFIVSFFLLLFSNDTFIWVRLLVSFCASLFFLLLHLVTKGKGMGLGDVKLALPFALLMGFPLVLPWLFTSFLIGAVVGIVLLAFGKTQMKAKIAFGPFMVVGFWVTLIFGSFLVQYLTPIF